MRPSVQRDHSQNGIFVTTNNGEFAKYDSLDSAARDIVLYMKARRYPTTEMELFDFVALMKGDGYFIEPKMEYYKLVVAWLER